MMRSKDSIFLSYDLTFLFLLFFIIDGQPLADLFEMPSIIIKEKKMKSKKKIRKKKESEKIINEEIRIKKIANSQI